MKVTHVYKDRESQPRHTMHNILKSIFPDFPPEGYRTKYYGVEFSGLYFHSMFSRGNLQGIQISTFNRSKNVFKRVMVKKDEIDENAIKTKFEELKILANEQAIREKKASDESELAENCVDRVYKKLGLDRYDSQGTRKSDIWKQTADSVTMYAHLKPEQMIKLQELLGEDAIPKTAIRVVVPEDKAEQAYKIMEGLE